ncbi:MAG: hypothetical protein HGB26_00450 [Desulfobulbaceae bacterium]|nr:hypothetical protein [Desulfobulbaceae bacterium]
MQVRNINGTSDNNCKCSSWLEHWKIFSGKYVPVYCPVSGCTETPTVGAHVQKDNALNNNWYIIPLCKTHNGKKGETLTVDDSTTLAPANVSETCGAKNAAARGLLSPQ